MGGLEAGLSDTDKLTKTIKVTLTVKEINNNNNNILAKDTLIIEDYNGIYKVKK